MDFIYRIERKYVLIFVFITTILTSIVGQLPFVSLLSSAILVLFGFYIIYLKIKYRISFPVPNLPLLLLILILSISIIMSMDYSFGIKILIFTGLQFFILSSGYKYSSFDISVSLIRLFNVFISLVSILTFIGLLLYFIGVSFDYGDLRYVTFYNGSFSGLYLNPNTTGIVSYMALAFLYYKSIVSHKKSYFLFFLHLTALLLSSSRSAILSLMLLFFVYKYIVMKRKIYKILILLLAFGFIAICAVYWETIMDSMASLFNKAESDISNGRFMLWTYAFQVIQEHPLWGVGRGNFENTFLELDPQLEYSGLMGGGLHNFYIQTATIYGCSFLFALLFFFISIFRIKIQKTTDDKYCLLVFVKSFLLSLCFLNFFESNILFVLNIVTTFFWIFIGILLLPQSDVKYIS